MWRYVTVLVTICSPVVASLHATLYEGLKRWLSSTVGIRPLAAGLIASLGISGIGIGTICILGWLVWRVWGWRIRAKVQGFYREHVVKLMRFLNTFQYEINSEIELFRRLNSVGQYNPERWDKLMHSYDANVGGSKFMVTEIDIGIEKCLRKNVELGVLRELRKPITEGLRRVQEILGAAQRGLETGYRAAEMAADTNTHLQQFCECLTNL